MDERGRCDAVYRNQWFAKDKDFDAKIRAEFCATYVELVTDCPQRPPWVAGPDGLLAAVIVLDQFSRNMFRDSASMYLADPWARALTYEMIALGYDRRLPFSQRSFVYMPLMHSEELVHQQRCVELFEDFAGELDDDRAEHARAILKFAVAHRDIVARFGRFPHRNEVLGRSSTEQELSFLTQPGSSF